MSIPQQKSRGAEPFEIFPGNTSQKLSSVAGGMKTTGGLPKASGFHECLTNVIFFSFRSFYFVSFLYN